MERRRQLRYQPIRQPTWEARVVAARAVSCAPERTRTSSQAAAIMMQLAGAIYPYPKALGAIPSQVLLVAAVQAHQGYHRHQRQDIMMHGEAMRERVFDVPRARVTAAQGQQRLHFRLATGERSMTWMTWKEGGVK